MLSEYKDDNVRIEVYRGTLGLLLQQAVSVYWEAASLKIEVDIHEMLNERLCSHGRIGIVGEGGRGGRPQRMGYPKSGVMRVEKKDDTDIPRGKW